MCRDKKNFDGILTLLIEQIEHLALACTLLLFLISPNNAKTKRRCAQRT